MIFDGGTVVTRNGAITRSAGTLTTVDFGLDMGYRYGNGYIDEAMIFARNLSTTEISDIYNNYGYATPNYPGKTLVRKWVSPAPTASVGAEEEPPHCYPPAGYIESSIFKATSGADWKNVSWFALPSTGTSIVVKVRTGSDDNPYDGGWSDWCVHNNDTENESLPNNRYAQYRVELSTTDNSVTPRLYDITLNYLLM
jgi:hypothetical protein